MQEAVLVQPPPGGRLSGGFLYNVRMAKEGAWELSDVAPERLQSFAEGLHAHRLLLLDSIWLTEAHAECFVALSARGHRVGVMLHSFPSMIAATESGLAPPARPSEFELRSVESFDVVVVPGRHYADMLRGSDARIVIAEPGVDEAWRAPPRRREGPCRLVSVGAVTPRKGFVDVATALERRAPLDFRWTIVGSLDVDRTYAERLGSLTRNLPSVVLLGQRAPTDVQNIVRGSDVLVMPSYDENHPLVLLEAMAASVPAVAYAAGAAEHIVEHQRQGLICPIGDVRSLAAHLDRLLDDEGARHAMAVECWRRQSSIPTWSAAARSAREALQTLMTTHA